jgi:hypothetical protein
MHSLSFLSLSLSQHPHGTELVKSLQDPPAATSDADEERTSDTVDLMAAAAECSADHDDEEAASSVDSDTEDQLAVPPVIVPLLPVEAAVAVAAEHAASVTPSNASAASSERNAHNASLEYTQFVARLETLESQLAAVPSDLAPPPPAALELTLLEERLQQLERRLDDLASAPPSSVVAAGGVVAAFGMTNTVATDGLATRLGVAEKQIIAQNNTLKQYHTVISKTTQTVSQQYQYAQECHIIARAFCCGGCLLCV